MGIKQLNSFLKQNCKNSIKTIKFQEVSNKKIAIDISIYLYKFLEEGSIVDNLFMMIGLFRRYNIVPVFIFDGKPPKEKYETLEKRRSERNNAKDVYCSLEKTLSVLKKRACLKNQEEIFRIEKKMREEYKKTIRLTKKNIAFN